MRTRRHESDKPPGTTDRCARDRLQPWARHPDPALQRCDGPGAAREEDAEDVVEGAGDAAGAYD